MGTPRSQRPSSRAEGFVKLIADKETDVILGDIYPARCRRSDPRGLRRDGIRCLCRRSAMTATRTRTIPKRSRSPLACGDGAIHMYGSRLPVKRQKGGPIATLFLLCSNFVFCASPCWQRLCRLKCLKPALTASASDRGLARFFFFENFLNVPAPATGAIGQEFDQPPRRKYPVAGNSPRPWPEVSAVLVATGCRAGFNLLVQRGSARL